MWETADRLECTMRFKTIIANTVQLYTIDIAVCMNIFPKDNFIDEIRTTTYKTWYKISMSEMEYQIGHGNTEIISHS